MTAAELIAELQNLAPETIVFVQHNLSYYPPQVVRVSKTEYGYKPVGTPKVVLVADKEES